MKRLPILLVSFYTIFFSVFSSSTIADEMADRDTLRGMLSDIETAINNRDLSDVLGFFLPTSVVVFQNKTVLTGPDELQQFYTDMLGSSSSVLTDVKSVTAIGAPASFYGPDMAVAHGSVTDTYQFRGGSEMELESAWTTTVVRVNDQWRVASLHISANVFDNPIIDQTKKWLFWAAAGGLVMGAGASWLFMRRRRTSPVG